MDEKTRSSVEAAIEQAVVMASNGADPYAVAGTVAGRLGRSALLVLAEAALVDQIRRSQRTVTLDAERRAQKRAPKRPPTPEDLDRMQEIDDRFNRRITDVFTTLAAELRMEWTAELLGSSFALSDGTNVTWGEATTEQHQERIEMFASNAAANLEGAARHQAALHDLQQSGAQTLNDLAAVPV